MDFFVLFAVKTEDLCCWWHGRTHCSSAQTGLYPSAVRKHFEKKAHNLFPHAYAQGLDTVTGIARNAQYLSQRQRSKGRSLALHYFLRALVSHLKVIYTPSACSFFGEWFQVGNTKVRHGSCFNTAMACVL